MNKDRLAQPVRITSSVRRVVSDAASFIVVCPFDFAPMQPESRPLLLPSRIGHLEAGAAEILNRKKEATQ
jgi:hypothetical protein